MSRIKKRCVLYLRLQVDCNSHTFCTVCLCSICKYVVLIAVVWCVQADVDMLPAPAASCIQSYYQDQLQSYYQDQLQQPPGTSRAEHTLDARADAGT